MLGYFRRDMKGQDEMHSWKISFCGLLLAMNLEKGSSLQASCINAFAELLLVVKGALRWEGLFSL